MKKLSWYYKKALYYIKKKIDLDNYTIETNNLDYLFNHFGSDKGTLIKHPYDKKKEKIIGHSFGQFYEKYFNEFKNEKFDLLEIGAWKGASIAAFSKYFENANIFGLDKNFKFEYKSKKITFLNCDTTNIKDLKKIEKKIKNSRFRIIIDDGSHFLSDIIHNLKFFFKFLDNGGLYIIEDYKHPEYYSTLNNTKNELSISQIIEKLKKKELFKSEVLNESDQKTLMRNIDSIFIHKGIMKDKKTDNNVSDIVFFKKKLI